MFLSCAILLNCSKVRRNTTPDRTLDWTSDILSLYRVIDSHSPTNFYNFGIWVCCEMSAQKGTHLELNLPYNESCLAYTRYSCDLTEIKFRLPLWGPQTTFKSPLREGQKCFVPYWHCARSPAILYSRYQYTYQTGERLAEWGLLSDGVPLMEMDGWMDNIERYTAITSP